MFNRKLIVSADDFGLDRQITDAIIDCHVNGIVTSTSLIANAPATVHACSRAKDISSLAVGVHSVIERCKSVSKSVK